MLYNLILLLPCSVCLFAAVWLICKKGSNTKAQNILVLCLLLSVVFFFCMANYIRGGLDYTTYRIINILDCLITPFTIPSMYLYIRALTSEERFTWKDYIWFLPAFIIGTATCVLYLAMNESQTENYITSVFLNRSSEFSFEQPIYKLHYLFSVELYRILELFKIVGTAACAVVYIRRYHNRLSEFYSSLDDKSISLNNTSLYWFMLTLPFSLCIMSISVSFWKQHPIIASLFFIAYSIVVFGICYFGSQRRHSVENLAKDLAEADYLAIRNNYDLREEDEESDDQSFIGTPHVGRYDRYLPAFNKLINEDEIFLQSTIRADEIAAMMCTNRTYLSRMIKAEFKCTFSDYINQRRIEYAQKLMQEQPDIRLVDLAERSGFVDFNSFGRTFKQIAGSPPKEWLKNSLKKLSS